MAKVNESLLKLEDNYLFSEIFNRTEEFKKQNPDKKVIKLGIGDVTLPLAPAVIEAMHEAVEDMSKKETFQGYGKVQGYDFLINKIIECEYNVRGINLESDEVFVAGGAKGDLAGMITLFSNDDKVALADPIYPAYKDVNEMLGRENIVYLNATEENNFLPELPNEHVDIIYLCSPNNPTGVVLSKEELTKWVDYAKENDAIIFYDSAYEVFITDENIPHSIYEIEGAKEVAIEFRSFSKLAGFTGVRGSFAVVPKQLKLIRDSGEKVSANYLWRRSQSSKFGSASYIMQKGAEAIYSEEGRKQILENIQYYKNNSIYMKNELEKAGFNVFGAENSPYVWLKTPNNMKSWEFFDKLLNEVGVVGTPGVGFGKNGEGYFRLTGFSSKEDTIEAVDRIIKCVKGN